MVVDRLVELGYSKEDAQNIRNSHPLVGYTEETLLKKVNDAIAYFEQIKVSKKAMRKMFKKIPGILGLSIDNLEQKRKDILALGFTPEEFNKMVYDYPTIYSNSIEKLIDSFNNYIALGYSKATVRKMVNSCAGIIGISKENLESKMQELEGLGFNRKQIFKMGKFYPQMFRSSVSYIKQKIQAYMVLLGYNPESKEAKDKVISMLCEFPTLLSFDIGLNKKEDEEKNKTAERYTIFDRFDTFINMGFTKEQTRKMIVECPSIMGLGKENVMDRIDFFQGLDFSKEATISILASDSFLFGYDKRYIVSKIKSIFDMGISYLEIKKMIQDYPAILGQDIEKLRDKLIFMQSIGLLKEVVMNAKNLMQSNRLTMARHYFYSTLNPPLEITPDNFRMLYMPSKQFERKFGYSNAQITAMFEGMGERDR